MTEIIIKERGTRKTTELIKRAAKDGLYILTDTKRSAEYIVDMARRMGLYIPFPVTMEEYLKGNEFRGSCIRRDGLLIDDADAVFQTLLSGIPIRAVTISDRGNIFMDRLEQLELENRILRGYLERLGVWPSEELMHIDDVKED